MTTHTKKAPSAAPEHRAAAAAAGPIKIAIVTVSDTRTRKTDVNAPYLKSVIKDSGNECIDYRIIKDDPAEIARTLAELVIGPADVVLFNGGTGISSRDTTIDVLEKNMEKDLPGFGELFRMLSYEDIGPAAVLSRATAGIYRRTFIIATPGSPAAVQLAWEKIIEPELQHFVRETKR